MDMSQLDTDTYSSQAKVSLLTLRAVATSSFTTTFPLLLQLVARPTLELTISTSRLAGLSSLIEDVGSRCGVIYRNKSFEGLNGFLVNTSYSASDKE